MAQQLIQWDTLGSKEYEMGCDHGVLYPQVGGAYPKGVPWNGLISVNETPSGGDDNAIYSDNIKYASIRSAEDFGATINCYTYPKEWAACNGEKELITGVTVTQQNRLSFGMSYRTKVGNDTEGQNKGYKIHLIYGGTASPSEKTYETVNDSVSAVQFSFPITTVPVAITVKDSDGNNFQPASKMEINSIIAGPDKMAEIEKILYGTAADGEKPAVEGRLPLPDEVLSILSDG